MAGNIYGQPGIGYMQGQAGNAGNAMPVGSSMVTFINDDSMAANYPIAPGTTAALINANDPNDGRLFIKSTAPNGMPNPMRVFAMQEITPKAQGADVVTRKEFDALNMQLQQLIAALQSKPVGKPADNGGAAK